MFLKRSKQNNFFNSNSFKIKFASITTQAYEMQNIAFRNRKYNLQII